MSSIDFTVSSVAPGPAVAATRKERPVAVERQDLVGGGKASPPADAVRPGGASAGSVEKAVAFVEDFLQGLARNLQFRVDEGSGNAVVTVLDGETGEVVRQMPSEEFLASARYLAESFGDASAGALFDASI